MPALFIALPGLLSTLAHLSDLAVENLALRQQLATLRHAGHRPKLTPTDRAFWALLSRWWPKWRDALHFVKPDTVVAWHRQGFRLYWRWKSRRPGPGRPPVDPNVIELIRQISRANPRWGAPRIHGELLKLGVDVGQTTVAKYMVPRSDRPKGGSWSTFLANHLPDLVAADFIVVPTASFRVLYAWVLLSPCRREVLHFGVTANPTALWLSNQLKEAFAWKPLPGALLRDRDGAYGNDFRQALARLGVRDLMTMPRSPWQNGLIERLMGSIRRELLDHVVVLDERHLERLLTAYFAYHGRTRTHLALDKDAPDGREVMGPELGEVIALPEVGGLHHRYERRRRRKAA